MIAEKDWWSKIILSPHLRTYQQMVLSENNTNPHHHMNVFEIQNHLNQRQDIYSVVIPIHKLHDVPNWIIKNITAPFCYIEDHISFQFYFSSINDAILFKLSIV